jgi:hypothetical protein
MKICKLYINKAFLAEKLGIDESQFAIGQVESNISEIGFTILIDENADIGVEKKVFKLDNNGGLIRRSKL